MHACLTKAYSPYDDFLQASQIPVHVSFMVSEVQDRIHNQLARTVVGYLTASFSSEQRVWRSMSVKFEKVSGAAST